MPYTPDLLNGHANPTTLNLTTKDRYGDGGKNGHVTDGKNWLYRARRVAPTRGVRVRRLEQSAHKWPPQWGQALLWGAKPGVVAGSAGRRCPGRTGQDRTPDGADARNPHGGHFPPGSEP
jgi:hypothetical protein